MRFQRWVRWSLLGLALFSGVDAGSDWVLDERSDFRAIAADSRAPENTSGQHESSGLELFLTGGLLAGAGALPRERRNRTRAIIERPLELVAAEPISWRAAYGNDQQGLPLGVEVANAFNENHDGLVALVQTIGSALGLKHVQVTRLTIVSRQHHPHLLMEVEIESDTELAERRFRHLAVELFSEKLQAALQQRQRSGGSLIAAVQQAIKEEAGVLPAQLVRTVEEWRSVGIAVS